ncbi:MAG TPA: hypothetical protein VJ124_05245 [Pyrinomonadaceae bacterium]|nr:hypothetical protein [Pyrinomonadaceae bacterium]
MALLATQENILNSTRSLNTPGAGFDQHADIPVAFLDFLLPLHEKLTPRQQQLLKVLADDKLNEATCLMDGAWTGHPDQNDIAVRQFPYPNQINARKPVTERPSLRPLPDATGKITLDGTRAAIRTVIRYRNGVLNGKGASLLDGYMEDLATDRIYRLMIAQRIRHCDVVKVTDRQGEPVKHTPEFISQLFDEELDHLIRDLSSQTGQSNLESLVEARWLSELMICNGEFDPI